MKTKTMISNQSIGSKREEDWAVQPTFTHQQLHDALMYAQDALERALIPFFLLDDVAKAIHDEELPVFNFSEISVGVLRKNWSDEARSIFKIWRPEAEITKVNVFIEHQGVPIVIWLIDGDYTFFRNPDFRFYTTEEFYVPNPFKLYWKERDLVFSDLTRR